MTKFVAEKKGEGGGGPELRSSPRLHSVCPRLNEIRVRKETAG